MLRATLAEDPFGGFSRPLAIATTAMALYTGWTLLSGAEQRATDRTAAEATRDDPRSPADAVELRDQVSRALSLLSSDERETVALRYGADLSVPEIARITREKAATVEKRVYRPLIKLREHLQSARATR